MEEQELDIHLSTNDIVNDIKCNSRDIIIRGVSDNFCTMNVLSFPSLFLFFLFFWRVKTTTN